eukprot:gnl/MRDRNA2_/MRDRNA2_111307_c0_seq1.p1 gnl/MRDRNA2_/MRDRNA2_111307_c0~~gnl/MRDRNA2_/MRDRNA2_111307_c0_seq1.p1  ORF type:complete len:640 (-),score=155.17 gnl/MRDRNA2_/MRDRNA2_111307_c0_seq1:53-1972(-)
MTVVRAGLACVVLSVLCRASHSTDEQRARAWLLAHDNPDDAGMNELRATDPTAFGIVQALLTKQKLGLLDPRHPSASFTDAPPKEHKSFSEAAEEAGITNDTPVHAEAAADASSKPYPDVPDASPYPEVSHHSNDPWSFKAATHDDDLVNSVLGQVAELKDGGSLPSTDRSLSDGGSSNSLLSSSHAMGTATGFSVSALSSAFSKRTPAQPSLDWGNRYSGTSNVAEPQVPSNALDKPQAVMSQANSYVSSPPRRSVVNSYTYTQPHHVAAIVERRRAPVADINPYLPPAPLKVTPIRQAPSYTYTAPTWRTPVMEKPQPAMSQQNSYLKGMDFGSEFTHASRRTPVVVEKPQPVMSQENSYLKGIDFSSELADANRHQIKTVLRPLNVAPQVSMNQENRYLQGIDFSSELAAAAKSETAREVQKLETPVDIERPKPHLAPVPQQALDDSVDAPDGSFLKGFNFNDEMKEVGMKQAVEPLKTAVNGYLNGINFNAAKTEVAAPVPEQPRPQMHTEPAQENQYAHEIKLDAQATQAVAQQDLEQSDFHKLAAQYRQEETPPPAPRQSVDLGSAFENDLAAAKNNNWKRALAATDWGRDQPRMSMTSVTSKVNDKNDDDDFDLETPGMITNHISSWLDKAR